MASTYSNLKIQLMATGENSGTWGNVTNDNLGIALEEAIVGSEDVTFASGNVTLTLTNTNASQTARNLRLNLTGTTGGARDLIVPAIEKVYIVNNGCADTVTIKVTGQTGVAVPAGKTMFVYNTGVDCTDAITHLRNLTLATALPPGSGGTGINTVGTAGNVLTSNGTAWVSQAAATTTNASALTTGVTAVNVGGTGATTLTAENVIIGNTTGAVKFVAPGTSGNVLTSNGSAWLSQAAAGGGGDYIMQVYGSPATWTKPAGLKAVKVTVVGGGGGGGGAASPGCSTESGGGGGGGGVAIEYLDAPALPGPVAVTVGSGGAGGPAPGGNGVAGGTSSFGAFLSATGGGLGNGTSTPLGPSRLSGAGGAGSGGQLNFNGGTSRVGSPSAGGLSYNPEGGESIFSTRVQTQSSAPGGTAGNAYGGGGVGAVAASPPFSFVGGAGAAGVVIVEEFY